MDPSFQKGYLIRANFKCLTGPRPITHGAFSTPEHEPTSRSRFSYGMEEGMRRCADQIDCGFDNRDSDFFCRACALPLLNTALADRYVVEALLSKGGYAAVFRGVDHHLSRRIAIKVLLPSRTILSEHEHFLREARIAATLDHPNIAPVLDYGKDGSSVFLVMPLYTMGSLRHRLAQANGPLPTHEAIHNFHQLAHALYYAHTRPRPIIHRDIKPENILLHQEDHRLVITDFGIARFLEPGASTGHTITVRGTVGYMAPEQANGIVDPRSDQYGSAVVLYEMLTGYHPINPSNGSIPAVSSLNQDLPPALDPVLQRALLPHPEERYTDMLEFTRSFDFACRPTTKMRIPALQVPLEEQLAQQRHNSGASPAIHPPTGTGKSNTLNNGQRPNSNTASVREKCREADFYLRQQTYTQALQAYEEALRMDPLNFWAWHGKGTALYNQGNYRKAFDAYQHASEIEPNKAIVWVSAGMTLNMLHRSQQALVHFERALSIDPTSVPAWNGKAEAQMEAQLFEAAQASYEQALNLDLNSFHAWNGLGNTFSSLHNFSGALDAYSRALLVNPRSAVAWCNKAEALIRLGHNKNALDALDEATEMDPNYLHAWELKAEVYDALSNSQEAQKARRRARALGGR